jgi:hypothetical protein
MDQAQSWMLGRVLPDPAGVVDAVDAPMFVKGLMRLEWLIFRRL